MKKILIFTLILFTLLPLNAKAISSDAIIVMDMDSKRILYSKDIHEVRLIASITKIMTAIVAIENKNLDDVVKVDESILKAYGSGIYIQIGEEITLRDLLYGLMLRSGNDAAVMIACYVSGSEEEFVKLMNEKALSLGMKNTTFGNASGLDEKTENYSTAYDMALLTSYAMQNNEYKTIVGTKKHTVKTNFKTYVWDNKNRLLDSYKYTTGGKTGYTIKAKRTLVTTASNNNLNLVVVTLNDPDDFNNHKNMYEEMFKKYNNYLILDKDNFKVNDDTFYKDKLYIQNSVYYPIIKDETNSFTTSVRLEKKSNYKDGEKVGEIDVLFNDKVVKTESIYISKENITKPNKKGFFSKFIDWIKIW